MDIALLSGAYRNAGDFMIVHKCEELLKYVYPDCTIHTISRRNDLTEHLPQINDSDVVILGGGPALKPKIYPDHIPLVSDLTQIKSPLFAMGLGVSGKYNYDGLPKYEFSAPTKELWSKANASGWAIGCRDNYSANIMKRSGFESKMTGCVVWYDVENVNNTKLKSPNSYKNIIVSDPGKVSYHKSTIELLRVLKEMFPSSNIKFVFHRGNGPGDYTGATIGEKLKKLANDLDTLGIEHRDISSDFEGFKVYDDCDLHIGFRVHAHIYTLSKRRKSILISEDIRGIGFNQTIGLPNIDATVDYVGGKRSISLKVLNKIEKAGYTSVISKDNQFLKEELEFCLDIISSTQGKIYEWSFERMSYYFNEMVDHIKEIERLI